jgi:serine/threonine-protein kinase
MATRLGAYTLEKKIGAGGMADVYLAQGPRGTCVLKVPHPHLCDNPEFVRMFLDEAQILAQLHHRGIAQIFDLGHAGNAYYLAMEYVPGFDLMTISLEHERHGELMAPELCARIVADVADALHYAHEAKGQNGQPLNLIHRDVTPHNILLSRQGVVKLIDFGVARAANTMHRTQAGFVKGKYPYMSPEQVTGQVIDRRVDVYALGLVLYELLTNTRALQGNTEIEQIDAARSAKIRPVEQLRPNVPVPLRQILGGCLHPEVEGRYPTALAVKEDLEKYLAFERHVVGQEDLLRLFRVVAADTGQVDEEASVGGRPTEREQPVSGGGAVVLPAGPVSAEQVDALGSSPTAPSMKMPAPVPLPLTSAVPGTGPVPGASAAAAPVATGSGPRATGSQVVVKSKAPFVVLAGLSLLVIGLVLALWQPWSQGAVGPVSAVDAGARPVVEDFHFPPEDAGAAVATPEPTPVPGPVEDAGAVAVADPTPEPTPEPTPAEPDRRAAIVNVSASFDAEVLVDGKSWGRVPKELELAAGKHVIIVQNKAENFRKVVSWTLKPGETRDLVVQNARGTVTVDVQPFGKILVDGKSVTDSAVSFKELALTEGSHTIECVLEDPGLPAPRKKKQTVKVGAGSAQKLTFNMLVE